MNNNGRPRGNWTKRLLFHDWVVMSDSEKRMRGLWETGGEGSNFTEYFTWLCTCEGMQTVGIFFTSVVHKKHDVCRY